MRRHEPHAYDPKDYVSVTATECAGRIAVAIVLGFMAGVFGFLLWAMLDRGAQ